MSITSTPQPSVPRKTWLPSSGRSCSGSRAASEYAGGHFFSASSITSPLTRTIFFSRSTVAPLASQRSSARFDGKRTPTCSMIHSVASWIFLTSSVVKISSFSFGLLIDLMFLDIVPSRGLYLYSLFVSQKESKVSRLWINLSHTFQRLETLTPVIPSQAIASPVLLR